MRNKVVESRRKLHERQYLENENQRETIRLLKQHQIELPFPTELKECQPVKKACSLTQRTWRGKCTPIKSLLIMASVATYDGSPWYHVSFSHRDKLPNYEQVLWIRNRFFPRHMQVVQVFPEKQNHVNYHPYTLHLWANLCENPLPNFAIEGMI